jgi:hypothetical protein
VVFKTDEGLGLEIDHLGVDDDVADEPLLARFGPDVDEADARKALALGRLVVVAEELVAAAHSEDLGAGLDRALQRWFFVLEEVFVHERLLAILTTAEKEDIDLVHPLGGASAQLQQPRFVVAPFGSLQQGEDVAAVAVDVHEVGV